MVIYGVSFDLVGKQPIVLLKTADGNKFLPIWIGHPEAAAILMKLQGATAPRPTSRAAAPAGRPVASRNACSGRGTRPLSGVDMRPSPLRTRYVSSRRTPPRS